MAGKKTESKVEGKGRFTSYLDVKIVKEFRDTCDRLDKSWNSVMETLMKEWTERQKS